MESWLYSVEFNRNTATEWSKYTQTQIYHYLITNILPFINCSLARLRLITAGEWSNYASLLHWSGSSLVEYLDRIIDEARHDPPILFQSASLTRVINTSRTLVRTFARTESVKSHEPPETSESFFTEVCFQSSFIFVECDFAWLASTSEYVLSGIELKMTLAKFKSQKPKEFSFSLDVLNQNVNTK